MTEVVAMSADAVIGAYITLRSKKDKLKADYEERIKGLNAQMDKLEGWLQQKMSSDGVNSFATDYGTAYKITQEHASVSDMDALLDYIRDTGSWHLLEKRVSKAGVRALLDEEQPLPPGVNWRTSQAIGVRKPSER